jgi:hypothetical protein
MPDRSLFTSDTIDGCSDLPGATLFLRGVGREIGSSSSSSLVAISRSGILALGRRRRRRMAVVSGLSPGSRVRRLPSDVTESPSPVLSLKSESLGFFDDSRAILRRHYLRRV